MRTLENELGLSSSMTLSEIIDLFIDVCGEEHITNLVDVVHCNSVSASQFFRRSARPQTTTYMTGILVGRVAKIDLRATRQVPNWATSKSK